MLGESKELVSVIMPVYNGEDFLAKSIRSVLNQTYERWELIIVNDGSVDSSSNIALKFADIKGVKYYEHEKNKGIPSARNTGIKNSNGSLIAFIDQDDVWVDKKLSIQIETLKDLNYTYGIVGTGVYIINKSDQKIDKRIPDRLPKKEGDLVRRTFMGGAVITTTSLVRKDCFQSVGLLDESLFGCDDLEFWVRAAKEWKMYNIKEPLAKKRKHNTNAGNNLRQFIDSIRVRKRIMDNTSCVDNIMASRLGYDYYLLSVKQWKLSMYKKSRKSSYQAIGLDYSIIGAYLIILASFIGKPSHVLYKHLYE